MVTTPEGLEQRLLDFLQDLQRRLHHDGLANAVRMLQGKVQQMGDTTEGVQEGLDALGELVEGQPYFGKLIHYLTRSRQR